LERSAVLKKLKNRLHIDKRTEAAIIALSISFGFMIFLFSPMEIFVGSPSDFTIGFREIFFPMLFKAAEASLFIALLLNAACFINKALYTVLADIMFGALIAGYSQQLFMNGKMNQITGDEAANTDLSPAVTANLIVYLLLLLLPLILTFVRSAIGERIRIKLRSETIVAYVSTVIVLMQTVGLAATSVKVDWSKYDRNFTARLSYNKLLELSGDENIVVFIVDRFDGETFDEVLKEYPELNSELGGFTYYRNNVSHYTNTFPSIPNMLSGQHYEGEKVVDYVSRIWKGDTVPKLLFENGWRTTMVIDSNTTYRNNDQISGFCSNIEKIDQDDIEYNYNGEKGIIPTMTWLSMYKLLPYAAKGFCLPMVNKAPSEDFVTVDGENSDLVPLLTSDKVDLKLYAQLKERGLRSGENKTFTFIHINGMHDVSKEVSELYQNVSKADERTTLRGVFQILSEYFEQMKQLGIYDNSTILLLGDHGRLPNEIMAQRQATLDDVITTALLIKPKNTAAEPLKTDSVHELSNDYFFASILEYAGIDHEKYGVSYNDVINGDLSAPRYLQTMFWNGSNNIDYKALYKITGDARDFDNWEEVPEHE